MKKLSLLLSVVSAMVLAAPAAGQDVGSVVSESGVATPGNRFRLKAELKVNGRTSDDVSVPIGAAVARTVQPHGSLEISNVAIIGEGDLTPDISARTVIHFIDLYTRNPTSSGATVTVREAWLRFGKKHEALQPIPGTSVYVQLGKAPKFSKQLNRRFENYGLWGTATGRLEEIGLEAGGSFGSVVYWRASVANGNPLFMRDPNSLAGSNGGIDRTNATVVTSGFPILYEARADDLNGRGRFQYGGGLGFRFNFGEDRKNGVDLLGWAYSRSLADSPAELSLLKGYGGVSLPVDGTEKRDYGANVEARFGGLQLYGQYVHQDLAGLVRKGYEVELAYRIRLNGLFVSGDTPVLNWIQPTVRVSHFDSFGRTPGYFAPQITWDWTKYDFGFRLGILRGMDFTAEYMVNDAEAAAGTIHPNELLATLRLGF